MLPKWIRSNLNAKHIVTLVAAIALMVANMLLFSDETFSMSSYSSFLNDRNYNYSIVVDKDLREDCYAYYDRKISFAKDESLDEKLIATVLMRTDGAYTKNDFLDGIGTENLRKGEIVISGNLSRKHKLSIRAIAKS